MKKKFSMLEARSLTFTILVIAFIFSFTKWGVNNFDVGFGISNLIFAILIIGFSLLMKVSFQKYVSRKRGFKAEYKVWIFGLLLGIIFVFLTNGAFIFLAVGTLVFTSIKHVRVGRVGSIANFETFGWISLLGIFTNIVLAVVFKILATIPQISEPMTTAMTINLWLAFYAILPIPLLDFKGINSSEGLYLLYSSRWAYVGFFLLIMASLASLTVLSLISAVISVAVLTGLGWILYYVLFEQNL